jgi:hypothetical protein
MNISGRGNPDHMRTVPYLALAGNTHAWPSSTISSAP